SNSRRSVRALQSGRADPPGLCASGHLERGLRRRQSLVDVTMRIPSPFRDRRAKVELQLTPMIDCVFLLMIYFLWSSSFAIAVMALPSKLSQTGGSGRGPSNEPPPPEADFDNI